MKRKNIIIGIILALLMAAGIIIGILNPNKVKTINNVANIKNSNELNIEENLNDYQNENNQNTTVLTKTEILQQEEKEYSMQNIRNKFCKIGNIAIYYDLKTKNLYTYNFENNQIKKLASLQFLPDNIYFDGENVYIPVPYYNTANDKGIYKIDLDGNVTKIYNDLSLQIILTDNKIYFVKQIGYDEINQNPQGELYYMDKDGQNATKIADSVKNYFYINNNKIYYTSQDRKMYQIDLDGNNQTELVQGRKFVVGVNDKYLIYTDYGDQEAKHILNIETHEDILLGYFGSTIKCNGKLYVNARKRLDDGSISEELTIFELNENGTLKEYGKVDDITFTKYVINNKAYLTSGNNETKVINLENMQEEDNTNYKDCQYFIGGYGYKIDNSNIDDIKIEKIEL